MGLTTTIGKDGIHHYNSNPSRSIPHGLQYGLLMLTVQMYIQGGKISYRPCARPGERVPPFIVQITRQAVDFNYPNVSGIQARLDAEGWRAGWCKESRVPTLELEGWEIVVETDRHGMPTSFCLPDKPENQVYVKTRQQDLQALANNSYFRQQPGLIGSSVDASARTLSFQFDGH